MSLLLSPAGAALKSSFSSSSSWSSFVAPPSFFPLLLQIGCSSSSSTQIASQNLSDVSLVRIQKNTTICALLVRRRERMMMMMIVLLRRRRRRDILRVVTQNFPRFVSSFFRFKSHASSSSSSSSEIRRRGGGGIAYSRETRTRRDISIRVVNALRVCERVFLRRRVCVCYVEYTKREENVQKRPRACNANSFRVLESEALVRG